MNHFDANDDAIYSYGGPPWPPPRPADRAGQAEAPYEPYAPYAAEPAPPGPQPPRPPYGRRRAVAIGLAAGLAAFLGVVGYGAVTDDGPRSATPVPATTAPSRPATTDAPTITIPSTTPSTPSTTTPAVVATGDVTIGVVDVNTRLGYQGTSGAGTGIVISPTEILTNNHVIDGSTSVRITVVATGETFDAEVIGTDEAHDVALLRIEDGVELQPAAIGDSDSLEVGDAVTAVGNAGGDGGEPTITTGTVTALNQSITAANANGTDAQELTGLIRMNAALQPGESGGPVFNAEGEVVGMNAAGSVRRRRSTGTANYAIPINTAMEIAGLIRSGEGSSTIRIGLPPFLGVQVSPPTEGTTDGVTIEDVLSDTPAEQIGLEAGDVITQIDGQAVAGDTGLSGVLANYRPGDAVSVTWIDGSGATRTEMATLVEGPA